MLRSICLIGVLFFAGCSACDFNPSKQSTEIETRLCSIEQKLDVIKNMKEQRMLIIMKQIQNEKLKIDVIKRELNEGMDKWELENK